jgi:hypothetical protein
VLLSVDQYRRLEAREKVLLICLQCLLSEMGILIPHELKASKLSLLTSIEGIFAHCVAINK